MAEDSIPKGERVCAGVGHDCAFSRAGSSCMDNIRLFAELPPSAKRELLARARHTAHASGDIIVHEGDPIDSIIVVRTGRIKTYRSTSDGEQHVLDVLPRRPGAVARAVPRQPHLRLLRLVPHAVRLCLIHRADVEQMLANHPDVAMGLIRMVCTELDRAEERIMMLSIRDPRRRLAEYLLTRDRSCTGPEIHLKLDDIASSVGLRPETVSRNIARFDREGLVRRMGRGRLLVLDREGLARVSKS